MSTRLPPTTNSTSGWVHRPRVGIAGRRRSSEACRARCPVLGRLRSPRGDAPARCQRLRLVTETALIAGAGGFGREILQYLRDLRFPLEGFLDDRADALAGFDLRTAV